MTVFELAKTVPLPEAARNYGVKVQHGRACCLFHDDQNPSMMIKDDHFHCFACGAHGDVVAFVAQLFNCDMLSAARKLCINYNLTPCADTEYKDNSVKIRRFEREEITRMQDTWFYTMLRYKRLLMEWEDKFAPALPFEEPDDRFWEVCKELPFVNYLLDEWLAGNDEERNAIMQEPYFEKVKKRLRELEVDTNEQHAPVA